MEKEAAFRRLMSYNFEYNRAKGILRCRLSGDVTDQVFRDFFRAGASCAARMQPSAGVVDLSEVTSFNVSSRTIEELARAKPAVDDPRLKRIVIAASPDTFGMMRMFEMEAEKNRPDIHVVHSEREAWAILAVQSPNFRPFEQD